MGMAAVTYNCRFKAWQREMGTALQKRWSQWASTEERKTFTKLGPERVKQRQPLLENLLGSKGAKQGTNSKRLRTEHM